MSTTSNKPLTISLQNLNTLYCKYLNQYILQHLPKSIVNDLNVLLGMKSAIDVYKYLDNKLNVSQNVIDNNNTNFQAMTNNSNKQRKSSQQKRSLTNNNNNIEKDNNSLSNINRRPYMMMTTEGSNENNRQKQSSTKRMNSLLKRANTYVLPKSPTIEDNNNNKFQPFTNIALTKVQTHKQPQSNKQQTLVKRVHSHTHSTTHIPVTTYLHQQSSSSQNNSNNNNRYYQSPDYKKPSTINKNIQQQQQNVRVNNGDSNSNNNISSRGNTFNLRSGKNNQGEGNFHKQKISSISKNTNNNSGSENGGSLNKIQFAKTYSTKDVTDNNSNNSHNFLLPNNNPNKNLYSTTTQPINRIKLLALVKHTRQIFADNAKKILRYESLSNDLLVQQQQLGNNSNNGSYIMGSSNSTNNNSSNGSNSYGYNVIGGGVKKY